MKKLTLDLDQLTVDSFDTSETGAEKGTVFGEQCTCYTNCTCPGCPTCDHTQCQQNTCDFSCNGSCWTCQYDPTCDGGYTCNYTVFYKHCCPY
jgi:hypothetical protein